MPIADFLTILTRFTFTSCRTIPSNTEDSLAFSPRVINTPMANSWTITTRVTCTPCMNIPSNTEDLLAWDSIPGILTGTTTKMVVNLILPLHCLPQEAQLEDGLYPGPHHQQNHRTGLQLVLLPLHYLLRGECLGDGLHPGHHLPLRCFPQGAPLEEGIYSGPHLQPYDQTGMQHHQDDHRLDPLLPHYLHLLHDHPLGHRGLVGILPQGHHHAHGK